MREEEFARVVLRVEEEARKSLALLARVRTVLVLRD